MENNAPEQEFYAAMAKVRDRIGLLTENLPEHLGKQLRQMMEFRISLSSETDRGSALMAAAFLDDRLKSLLEARLVTDLKLTRRAFEFNGSLGTFSSRIDFSYLLGLLPKNAHRDLHLVRTIRNKFAHTAEAIGFDNPEVKPHCDSLVFHGVSKEAEPGAKYRRSVMALLTVIYHATNKAEHIQPEPDSTIPDTAPSHKTVSEIWAKLTDGLPYPVAHHHADAVDTSSHEPK